MGITRDSLHKRRLTGGRRKETQKKRKYALGRPAAMTRLGPKRVHVVRGRGGNLKYRALRLETGNFSWGSESCTRRVKVLNVVYNASNNELVRTKTLVKNAIIQIDATPFRQFFEAHYGVALGRKKVTKDAVAAKKDTKKEAVAKKETAKKEAAAASKKDAAAKKDAKKDAGKKDAAAGKKDSKDATASKKDSKDAGKKDAGKKDAGKKDAAAGKKDSKDATASKKDSKDATKKDAGKKVAGRTKEGKVAKPTREKSKEEDPLTKKKSSHLKRKLKKRLPFSKIDQQLIDQFTTGRLFARISSRPGQSGRCDGYILEGQELGFYLKKLKAKKEGK